jgi:uncharacterized protein
VHVVDTNVLLYAVDSSYAEHARCRALLETWRTGREPWGAPWRVFYEFLRVATHPRVLPRPLTPAHAWTFIDALLRSESFTVLPETERHAEFAALTLHEIPMLVGNILHDVHTAVVMREHGIRRIYTRDTDFHRFAFLEVVDPLTSESAKNSGDSQPKSRDRAH